MAFWARNIAQLGRPATAFRSSRRRSSRQVKLRRKHQVTRTTASAGRTHEHAHRSAAAQRRWPARKYATRLAPGSELLVTLARSSLRTLARNLALLWRDTFGSASRPRRLLLAALCRCAWPTPWKSCPVAACGQRRGRRRRANSRLEFAAVVLPWATLAERPCSWLAWRRGLACSARTLREQMERKHAVARNCAGFVMAYCPPVISPPPRFSSNAGSCLALLLELTAAAVRKTVCACAQGLWRDASGRSHERGGAGRRRWQGEGGGKNSGRRVRGRGTGRSAQAGLGPCSREC